VPNVPVAWAIALFSVAYFGQQSWSTLVMILPTDIFPKSTVGAVAGLVGFGGAMGGSSSVNSLATSWTMVLAWGVGVRAGGIVSPRSLRRDLPGHPLDPAVEVIFRTNPDAGFRQSQPVEMMISSKSKALQQLGVPPLTTPCQRDSSQGRKDHCGFL